MEVLLSSVVVLLETKKGKPWRVFPPLQQDFFTSPFSDSLTTKCQLSSRFFTGIHENIKKAIGALSVT